MRRRDFTKLSLSAAAIVSMGPTLGHASVSTKKAVRLGGPIYGKHEDPDLWANKVKNSGYRAAYCPLQPGADDKTIAAYKTSAEKHDILIAEVGAWSNMVSPDEEQRKASIEKCIQSLELADQIHACCCVNVSGSRNLKHWAGPHEDNFKKATFDLIVETTRKIIDAVNPTNTYFTLEVMPWAFPDSTDTYLDLIKAINRKRFGAHIDPVNMVVSPRLYFNNGEMIKDCFKRLAPHIRSCHAKDIILREDNYIPQMDELRPGLGRLNYEIFLTELAKLTDIPLMMEHLDTEEEYLTAASHIKSVGNKIGIEI